MKQTPPYAVRKSIRISGFDYASQNYYFITICTKDKQPIFGSLNFRNACGQIAWEEMRNIPAHYRGVAIDHFVIMPNHVHAIVAIQETIEEKPTLNNIIGSYKSGVTRRIRELFPDLEVWQRSYYDHVIWDRQDYENIWEYVEYNPLKWEDDRFYPGTRKP